MSKKNHHKVRLQHYLLPHSKSQHVDDMMHEWKIKCIHYAWALPYDEEESDTPSPLTDVHFVRSKKWYAGRNSGIDCPCSHPNIHYLCYISNTFTKKTVIVGRDCINKFLDIHLPRDVWRKLEKAYLREPVIFSPDILATLPPYKLNAYDTSFMESMHEAARKTKRLTPRQRAYLVVVNTGILRQVNHWHLMSTDNTYKALSHRAQNLRITQLLNTIFDALTAIRENQRKHAKVANKHRPDLIK